MPTLEVLNYDALYTLMKGDPGTWKSSTAVTYPLPQYWFSFDRKMRALALPAKKHGIDLSKITYDDYNSWTMHRPNNQPSALAVLEKMVTSCNYRTVIFDSVTTIADAMLRQVLDSKVGQKRKSGESAGKIIGGIDVSEVEDFNAEGSGLKPALVIGAETNVQVSTVNTSEDYARTVLPLDKIMPLGPDINFYKTYIQPAIEKMKVK